MSNARKLGHQILLSRANIQDVAELLSMQPSDLAKKLSVKESDVQQLIDDAAKPLAPIPRRLSSQDALSTRAISTGDPILDEALGGGIFPGLVTELVGEGSAGKTQLALQLSLTVQFRHPHPQGSACYLTTTILQTTRLEQFIESNPLFASECDMSRIFTLSVPNPLGLISIFERVLPEKIASQANTSYPVKLIIIDSLGQLFRQGENTSRPTTASLVERSKLLYEISAHLHAFASSGIAIVALNEVSDVFAQHPTDLDSDTDLIYKDQSKHFAQSDGKEARMGLVWSNQINVRIFLSRTDRRIYLPPSFEHTPNDHSRSSENDGDNVGPVKKKRRVEAGALAIHHSSDTPLRKFSVVVSTTCAPITIDFVISPQGIKGMQIEEAPVTTYGQTGALNEIGTDGDEYFDEDVWDELLSDPLPPSGLGVEHVHMDLVAEDPSDPPVDTSNEIA